MQCVLSQCMTFAVVVILSSQCDWFTIIFPLTWWEVMLLVSTERSLLSSSD